MSGADSLQVMPLGVRKGFLRDNLEVVCFATLLIMFFKTFVGQQFSIPSASMRNTLMIGDHLLVNKFLFAVPQWSWEERLFPMRAPVRGDIIVFRYPGDREQDWVKRCVALPGDTVRIRDKRLFVNGRLVTGPWEYHILDSAQGPVPGPWPPGRDAGPLERIPHGLVRPSWPYADPGVNPAREIVFGFRDNLGPVTVPRATCWPWATIGRTAPTAGSGVSCRWITCAAGPSSSGGASGKAATTTPKQTCRAIPGTSSLTSWTAHGIS